MTGVRCAPEDWVGTTRDAVARGYGFFEWLGAVDEIGRAGAPGDVLRVVLVLRDPASPGAPTLRLTTELPRDGPRLDSLGHVFAGARWHEREVAEMFGVVFVGGDPRRLLLGAEFEGTPMRKDEVLAARAATPWPGAKEPGETAASPSRRRMAPPGAPDPTVWGDRDPADSPAPAEEVAASAVGGRARRRRP